MAAAKTLSAGVVVIHESSHGLRFLLLRAFRHWDFPKGMVEAGESPLEAAKREVTEETGIVGLDFRWGEEHVETGPYGRGKIARYYLAVSAGTDVELRINPQLGFPEHNEYRWLTREQAVALASPRVQQVIGWASAILELPRSSHP